jgi:acyl-CoA thioester hydrolase
MNSLSGEIRDGRHTLRVRVYYEDTDFSGVVYHASYLRFMERGRTDYLRLLGINHRALFEREEGREPMAFAVRTMTIEFIKAAGMDDILDITTEPIEVGGASATLLQKVTREGETLVEARVRFAVVADGKPQRFPASLREVMRGHLTAAASPTGGTPP